MTRFDYLLNAFEAASQSEKPAENDYAAKRQALYAYVRRLESMIHGAASCSTCGVCGGAARNIVQTVMVPE